MLHFLIAAAFFSTSTANDIRKEASYHEEIQIQGLGANSARKISTLGVSGAQASTINETAREGHDQGALELTFNAFDTKFHLSVRVHTDMFHPNYKQVEMTKDGKYTVRSAEVPQCFYEGTVKVENHDEKGSAQINVCTGGVMGALFHSSGTYELHYYPSEAKHVIVNMKHHKPKKPFKCGMDSTRFGRRHGNATDTERQIHYHASHGSHEVEEYHDHEHDHHGDHGHHAHHHHGLYDDHHRHHKDRVKTQATAECASRPQKFVDLLIVNDYARANIRGEVTELHSSAIFNIVYLNYVGGTFGNLQYPGIQDQGLFDCSVTPRLIGQLTFRDGNPSRITYHSGEENGGGCVAASCGSTCTAGSFDSGCILDGLRNYFQDERSALENIYGPIDNAALLSEVDFFGGTVGLAFVGTMCSDFSTAISQVTGGSLTYSTATVSHEMGHNFGMFHDSSSVGSGFIMAASGGANYIPTQFSSESKADIDFFMNNDYPGASGCLENDAGGNRWDFTPLCGNGLVEVGEQCDVGHALFDLDSCCNSDCTLAPGCSCPTLDECCTPSGTIRGNDYVCRPAANSDCDVEERCDGVNSLCPVNLFSIAGATCSDTASSGVSGTGMCYEGQCVSTADACVTQDNFIYPAQATSASSGVCDYIICRDSPQANSGIPITPDTGTPCGSGKQCIAQFDSEASSVCVDSSTLRIYHLFRVCPDNNAVCRDETGTIVDSSFCADLGSLPPCAGGPTSQPTSFPTNQPTNFPTKFPTIPPTPQPTVVGGTYSPTGLPTASPTIQSFTVEVVFATLNIGDVTTSLRQQYVAAVAGLLNVVDDSFQLTFVAGSVVMTATFQSPSNGKSPEAAATDLSTYSVQQLTSVFGSTVSSVSEATCSACGSSDGGDSGGSNDSVGTGVAVGIALVVCAAIAVCALVWCCCCREESETSNQKTHRKQGSLARGTGRSDQRGHSQRAPPLVEAVVIGPAHGSGSLPPGWTLEYTAEGRPFYFHHATQKSQWEKPGYGKSQPTNVY
eukprot:CAMPEP_0184479910 /NCGR_PEP_ID=MMETSP0113_2-20130426/1442_1 /TAXON_ID=91329 /ORGANISM="Norrisiella sphaerica, Strain BC52" /LENGTH=1016 /DNA_ID=CAMNT_0026858077 /DNA_START=270 /DNA_END=3320 /DNA_ORIENTATION=-